MEVSIIFFALVLAAFFILVVLPQRRREMRVRNVVPARGGDRA